MKNQFVIYLCLVLIIINLCISVWIASQVTNSPSIASSHSTSLPDTVKESDIIQLFEQIKSAYNSGEPENVWDQFGSYAQGQMDKTSFIETINGLHKMFGTIQSGHYLYYEHTGKVGNLEFYSTHFSLILAEDSTVGTKGLLKITIAIDGDKVQIVEFSMNARAQ